MLAKAKHDVVRLFWRSGPVKLKPQPGEVQANRLNLLPRPFATGVLHRIGIHRKAMCGQKTRVAIFKCQDFVEEFKASWRPIHVAVNWAVDLWQHSTTSRALRFLNFLKGSHTGWITPQ
ncbi:hypothetical protein Q669_12965 [Labrenzia sp. C1B10]|nr:hypothetical protein Q669_12965 [Labrenzia sp. C1B10]